jgi:hypothetical protein
MLPPRMREIKDILEGKKQRAKAEEELLAELEVVDARMQKSDIVHVEQMFSGPSGKCPCCGK